MLQDGATLSEITDDLCRRLGVAHRIVPMSDQRVQTVLDTEEGALPMQHYFVWPPRRAQGNGGAVFGHRQRPAFPGVHRGDG